MVGALRETHAVATAKLHVPAEKYDHCVALCGNETQHKHVLASTIVALRDGFSKRRLGVQDDLLVFRAHKVVHDVGCGGIAA